MSDYTDILYEVTAPIARITLNRPEKMNALSNLLRGELIHACKEAEQDESVAVIVIKGAGRAFSAGYDIGGGMEAKFETPYLHPRSRRPDVGSTRTAWANHVNDTNWTDLEPVQARHRPGARLLPGRRHRAGLRLRLPHRGRGREDRLSARARHDHAGHGLDALAPADVESARIRLPRRLHERRPRPRSGAGPRAPSPATTSRRLSSGTRSAWP